MHFWYDIVTDCIKNVFRYIVFRDLASYPRTSCVMKFTQKYTANGPFLSTALVIFWVPIHHWQQTQFIELLKLISLKNTMQFLKQILFTSIIKLRWFNCFHFESYKMGVKITHDHLPHSRRFTDKWQIQIDNWHFITDIDNVSMIMFGSITMLCDVWLSNSHVNLRNALPH